MEPAPRRPGVRRHDSISAVVRRVFSKLGAGSAGDESPPSTSGDRSPPRAASPPDTPVAHHRAATLAPLTVTSGRPSKSTPATPPPKASPATPPVKGFSTPPEASASSPGQQPLTASGSIVWRKGSRRERPPPPRMRGWLKVSMGALRGIEWPDMHHLPTLFVSIEMDGQVFRTRYHPRSITPTWNDVSTVALGVVGGWDCLSSSPNRTSFLL